MVLVIWMSGRCSGVIVSELFEGETMPLIRMIVTNMTKEYNTNKDSCIAIGIWIDEEE